MIRLTDLLKEIVEENKPILTKRSSGGKTLILVPGSGVYQVGGKVRDELLGLSSKDIDYAVEALSRNIS